ncbi:MAG: hypothetical protein AB7U83_24060 [Vicinamibacterales bacterium]
MRHYAVEDEVRVGLDRSLRDWQKAGLLTSAQEPLLRADLATGLRRTGLMLRLGLAAFTVIAGAATFGLIVLATNMSSEIATAFTATALGAAAWGTATLLARSGRLYRYGVEEALVMGAVALFGFAAALLGAEAIDSNSVGVAWCFAMTTAAIAAGAAYRLFGFQYAAVGALYATALLPMASRSVGTEFKRVFAAVVCAAGYAAATRLRQRAVDDVRQGDAEVVRAAAAVGAYLALNAFVLPEWFSRTVADWFRWSSGPMVWLLPVAFGRAAVVERDPLLVRVALAAALATLVTNKAYLGWPRQPWDPVLLGVGLVALSLGLRRWLSAGADGERNGFTARPLVDSDAAAVQLGSLISVATPPTEPARPAPGPDDPYFSGGRSGGAGAGGTF